MDRGCCPKGVDASIELRVSHLMLQTLLCILHVGQLTQVCTCVCVQKISTNTMFNTIFTDKLIIR